MTPFQPEHYSLKYCCGCSNLDSHFFELLIIWLSTGPWINEQVECLHDVMQPLEMDTGLQAEMG